MHIFFTFIILLWVVFPLIINIYPSELGYSRKKKLFNIFWWFKNDLDPVLPIPIDGSSVKNDWYRPLQPQWWRVFMWGVRNPLPNFDRYVMGFEDKLKIWGPAIIDKHWAENGSSGDRHWPEPGQSFKIYLPFISWRVGNTGFRGHTGWKPRGEFAIFSFRHN